MKKRLALLLTLVCFLSVLTFASEKISDDGYRLLRQLFGYKNAEIEALKTLSQYTLDCNNVSDQQFKEKKCSDRMDAMQSEDRDLQVKHDVLGHDIAAHLRQHKDDAWLFLGLLGDDKEFSNLVH